MLLTGAIAIAAPASAAIDKTGVFSVPYDSGLWRSDAADNRYYKLTFDEWQRMGLPAPQPVPTDFVKYAWSPTIYAVSYFGPDRSDWLWEPLDGAAWQRAGYPRPRNADWVRGTQFFRYNTSSEVFAMAPDRVIHKLTFPEYQRAGSPQIDFLSNQGIVKWAFDSTIFHYWDIDRAATLSYQQWSEWDFPTPREVLRVPGDSVYQHYRESEVFYHSPGLSRQLTYAEWTLLGRPAPTQVNPPRPSKKTCASFRNQVSAQNEYEYYFPLYGDVHGLDGNGDGVACESYRY